MWTTTFIGGRPADVFVPADRPRFVLVFLSDLDEVTLRDNPVWTNLLSAHRFACVCPTGAESGGAERVYPPFDPTITGEQYLLDSVMAWATDHFDVGTNAVARRGRGRWSGGDQDREVPAVRSVAGLGSILMPTNFMRGDGLM